MNGKSIYNNFKIFLLNDNVIKNKYKHNENDSSNISLK